MDVTKLMEDHKKEVKKIEAIEEKIEEAQGKKKVSKFRSLIPAMPTGDKKMSRAIAIYASVTLLTENVKSFEMKKCPSKEDVVNIASYFTDFIEESE